MGTSAVIYNYEKRLEWILNSIQNSGIDSENKQQIHKFSRYLFAEGLSLGRIIKYLIEIHQVAKILNKPFASTTKDDILEIVQQIERKQYKSWTKHDYKLAIKKFFKFLKGTEDYPDEVRWLRLNLDSSSHLLPEELLTIEDVTRMARVATHPRDKALILTLYESGCRIGEILSLKLKNIRFDEYGAIMTVDGKTGMRRIRIIASVPVLATWIDNHPLKENPDSPLWICLSHRHRNSIIKYPVAVQLLKKYAKDAGLKKRIYPHLFRHSRATFLANHLTEAQLKQLFGWVQGSDVASTYVHLSGRDIDNALLRLNGIQVTEELKENSFRLITCPRCEHVNSPGTRLCNSCGLTLPV